MYKYTFITCRRQLTAAFGQDFPSTDCQTWTVFGFLCSNTQFSKHALIIRAESGMLEQGNYTLQSSDWETLTKEGSLMRKLYEKYGHRERKRVGLCCLSCGEGCSWKKESRPPPSLEFLTSTDMTKNRKARNMNHLISSYNII